MRLIAWRLKFFTSSNKYWNIFDLVVVAVTDLLREGSSSRFVTHGIPPVYLACALDMDRDDVDGTIHTLGPATVGFQGLCKQEAKKFPEVRRGEA